MMSALGLAFRKSRSINSNLDEGREEEGRRTNEALPEGNVR